MDNRKAFITAAAIVLLGFPVFYLIIRTSGTNDLPKETPVASTAAQAQPNDIKGLENAANSNPTFNNLLALSLAYINNKMPGKSVEPLKKAIALNPQSAVAYNDLGVAYITLQQYQDGIDACTKALQLMDTFQLAKNNLKWGIDEKNKTLQTIQALEKTPNEKKNAALYLDLGINYLHIGNYDKSIEVWNKILKSNPKNALALNNIGTAYMLKHQYDDAIATFKKALQIDPNNQLDKNNLAWGIDEKNKAATALKK